jgi:hypothetical protein
VAFDPNVWPGRALQEVFFVDPAGTVLHQCIRPLLGARCAPGHHGYQRACGLISGQASTGPFGSPADLHRRLILSQTSAGKVIMSSVAFGRDHRGRCSGHAHRCSRSDVHRDIESKTYRRTTSSARAASGAKADIAGGRSRANSRHRAGAPLFHLLLSTASSRPADRIHSALTCQEDCAEVLEIAFFFW